MLLGTTLLVFQLDTYYSAGSIVTVKPFESN